MINMHFIVDNDVVYHCGNDARYIKSVTTPRYYFHRGKLNVKENLGGIWEMRKKTLISGIICCVNGCPPFLDAPELY